MLTLCNGFCLLEIVTPPSSGQKNKTMNKLTRNFYAYFLLEFTFDPEDEGGMFLRNVG
jgi:hypothetical protein